MCADFAKKINRHFKLLDFFAVIKSAAAFEVDLCRVDSDDGILAILQMNIQVDVALNLGPRGRWKWQPPVDLGKWRNLFL